MSNPTYIGFLLPFHYLNAKLTKTLHHGFIKLKILQAFKHLIDALFLLFHIRMHIKIKCCSFPFQFCLIVIKAFLNVNLSYNVSLIKIVLCYIFFAQNAFYIQNEFRKNFSSERLSPNILTICISMR